MFTGIVEEVGTVRGVTTHRLFVNAANVMLDLRDGDSIAVNGACLTVVLRTPDLFAVDLSQETLQRTNLGALRPGDDVDLERALRATARLGGHIVQGHVDGVGTVVSLDGPAEARVLRVAAPPRTGPPGGTGGDLMRYVVEKGFIAVDGISLTVTGVHENEFTVAVIPYTVEHTVLRRRRAGDAVNLEVDILAKYVERLLAQRQQPLPHPPKE